jgi:hypothetical protein
LFDVRDTYALSDDEGARGFILLSPEARRAMAWPGTQGATATGFRWDEWYRDPQANLDAAAIDHFLDAAIATGLVDPRRIYVFGWSNGASIGQYAGASPSPRPPCPVPMPPGPQVPIILIRNLCDAVVPCSETNEWISDLTAAHWPFEHYNLWDNGAEASALEGCAKNCSELQGVHDHILAATTGVGEPAVVFQAAHEVRDIHAFLRNHAARGFANPTKITIPSPPGFAASPSKGSPTASSVKIGFQLLQHQTLPAASTLHAVTRMNGMYTAGP